MGIKAIGLGAGGHARVVIEILRSENRYIPAGVLDSKPELQGKCVSGIPVLGSDEQLRDLRQEGICHFFVGVGSIGDTAPRQRLFELGLQCGMTPIDAIHPKAMISPSAELGSGITIMAGAIINADAHLGTNTIVNTGAIVEHDCVIGNHVHVATGARLAGTVRIGDGAHIGIGAVVRQGLSVGQGAIVGAGAVVVKDVPPHTIVAGVPAHVIRVTRTDQ